MSFVDHQVYEIDVRTMEVVNGQLVLAASHSITIGLADDELRLELEALAVGPDGSVAVGGEQGRLEYPQGGGQKIHDAPWLAAYAGDGARRLVWWPPGPRIVGGRINAVALADDGLQVLAVGTENPALDRASGWDFGLEALLLRFTAPG